MLIEKMENRVLVGITIFLATMVLVGWVAINEPGRMASFQQQHLARSIEKGAELFANNCATCHGPAGLGSGRAPGLNNPQLFGVNFLASVDGEIARLEDAIDTLAAAEDTSDLSNDQLDVLEDQLAVITAEFGEDPHAAATAALEAAQAERQALIGQMQVAVDRGYDPEDPDRLGTLGWSGTLDSFVLTSLVSGRPVSTSYWPGPMPAWSLTAGGPMRQDQLEDLTNYIMNWGGDRQWTIGDLLAVEQFAKIPVEGGGLVEGSVAPDVANLQLTDIEANRAMIDETIDTVMAAMPEMIGDPNNGQTLYNGALACAACHNNAAVAPPTEGTYTRVLETRLQDPALAGYTAEHYLIESILVPNAYIAPPSYPANAMPQDFGQRLTAQDLLDLVAYIESQDGEDPLAG